MYASFPVRDEAYRPILANLQVKIVEKYGSADERPSRHKELYTDMRLEKGEWSRKYRGKTKFTYTEIEELRRRFGGPKGWPFIDWDLADAIGRAHALVQQAARALLPTPAPPGHAPNPTSAASSGQTERRRRGGQK